MNIPNTRQFINILKPQTKSDEFKLGKIDANYVDGRPKVIFDDELAVSTKEYPYIASYSPLSDDRVLLLRVSGSFVILGKII